MCHHIIFQFNSESFVGQYEFEIDVKSDLVGIAQPFGHTHCFLAD